MRPTREVTMGRVKPARQKRQTAKAPAGVPRVDMGLMQRAARAIPIMTPGRLPLLMDAVEARGRAEHEALKWQGDVAEETYNYLMGRSDLFPAAAYRVLPMERTADDVLETQGEMNYRYQLAEYASGAVKDRHAYFATEEMTALILAGAEHEIESYSLSAPDLPSPNGVAYLHRPAGHAEFLWWSTTGNGMVIASTARAESLRYWLEAEPTLLGTARTPHHALWALCLVHLTPVGSDEPPIHRGPTTYGEGVDPNDPLLIESEHVVSTFLSFCHMLHQEEIVDQTVQPSTPTHRGQWTQAHPRSSRITYLSVRRSRSPSSAHGASGRQYSSRWIVRGFWRRQWYPSLNRHLPIWIREQIRGPENAPLVYRDKVTIVKPPSDESTGSDHPPSAHMG